MKNKNLSLRCSLSFLLKRSSDLIAKDSAEAFYKNKEWLYQKYIIEKLSIHKIAIIYKIGHTTIWRWMKKFNIEIRTRSEAFKGEKNPMWGKTGEESPFIGKKHSEKSKKKMRTALSGKKHPNWNGGKKIQKGYIYIWKPKHFNADKNGYILESHLVYEDYWNEHVPKGYLPHHIDRDKSNNNICNLGLVTHSGHAIIHERGRKKIKND